MRLSPVHELLLSDVLAVGAPYAFALGGGCAVLVHGLVERPAQALGVATESPVPMAEIAAEIGAGLAGVGWTVRQLECGAVSARLSVSDPVSAEGSEIELLKEVFWRPPVQTGYGPVLALEDVVGTRVRALADRGLARDLIDVHAAADRWSHPELEELGRRHARGEFDLTELQARLARADWIDDREFAAYGLGEDDRAGLRAWAQSWVDDIAERLMEEAPPQDDGDEDGTTAGDPTAEPG
ncbi:nucleotidyl transferase AbiEii/AbiGii toxin family protein [Saccharothrix sp. ST-888]|uniref:nucleotidyl transferase AbiEii/AbiGii toxin family protein n=1 Tax=Saccharothrix sp. ST-888 TaxID=1427391 RepID=UPI0005ECCE6D|nr:nucleotidyl transferase AbiEii/AbiGii toxin family protein [Saccharothrix sp. ST-888]